MFENEKKVKRKNVCMVSCSPKVLQNNSGHSKSKMWNKKKIKIDKLLIFCIEVKGEWKWILVFKWFF